MKQAIIDKLDELMPKFPAEPPENSVEILKKRGYFKKDVLVYRAAYIQNPLSGDKEKVVKVRCSCCGETSYLDHVPVDNSCRYSRCSFGFIDPMDKQMKATGDTCVCPVCGKGCKALHIGSFKSICDVDDKIFLTVHNINGHLALLEWIATKCVTSDGEVKYFIKGYEGVVVVDKTMVRVVKYVKFMSSYSWISKWEYRKKYSDELYGWDKSELVGWNKRIVERSNCANSALYEYMQLGATKDKGAYPARYLQTWLLHPNVENLVRQGYSKYVTSVFTNATVVDNYYSTVYRISQTGLFINWKEVKPLKMLGLDKSEVDIAKKCTMDEILLYRRIRDKRGIKLNYAQIAAIGNDNRHFFAFASEDVNGVLIPIVRTLNYIEKQKADHKGDIVSAGYLLDYWNMLYAVYGEMIASEMYPRDIIAAHDAMVARKQEKESAELQAMFDKRLEELEALSFKDEETGLLIRPCRSQLEMIAEGKALSHCVGGYAKTHATGKTSILLIRKIEEPDIPYYTLEYNKGAVVQNRGKSNCSRTDAVKRFEEKWLNYIKTIKVKGARNGKRSSRKSAECAGA